jgi:hypothetical protein
MFNSKILAMKLKSLFIAVFLVTGFLLTNAQVVVKGDKVLNLGVGIGSALYSGGYYQGTVPPISASLEVVVKDDIFDGKGAIGAGGYLAYSAYKWEYAGYGWKWNNIILGPRGYLHYNFVEKLDTYAGVMLGYNIVSSTAIGTTELGETAGNSGGVIFSGFVGARYFFSDKFAVMGELGSGIAYLNLGVAFKL